MSRWRPGIPAFNEMDDDKARGRLLSCLDIPRWADEVLAGRPYDNLGQIEDQMQEAALTITDEELERALARHPRIGEPPDADRHDAASSESEQAHVLRAAGDAGVRARLEEGNRAYEARFGRVFIIRAAGRSPEDILDQLRLRLDNSDRLERAETIRQLTLIAQLRVGEMLS